MADVKISALSSATPGSTSLLVAVVNATTVKINVKDVVNAGKLPASTGVISSGNMLYGNSSGEVSSLAAPATGGVLVFSSVTGIPAWSMPTSGSVFIGSSLGIPAWTPAGTPGYLLQSTSGRATWKSPVRYVSAQVIASTVALATGDDKIRIHIPPDINGYDLTYVHAMVNATSADSTTMLIQVYNLTDTTDMLTSGIEIDGGEKGSETATSAAVINAAADDVATNDILRIDLDAVGSTAPKGMLVTLGFSLP